ncbi:conserved eukaryotic protein, HAPSTR1-like protein, stress response protein [Schizosaccharomyces osmophilus]|uniref:Conserved eukaryotic protein, HAPSTR1-like protein, stress response protein n=1 Tax=Schizosaccharomyces osmophilus TaxID=2545709 RepID=A0AAF0AV10_9SCHI|nr:conserved eukaryotic protein, HAPSTR1-like protein, stress response protein [Schizosaccharomyces osmophilus]WBW73081.1 conserved eukaryotic protein, HAPSTR1-like protein, stress response protein [Schizosaccharomyces osmophilus]
MSGQENLLSHFKQTALSVTQLYQASTAESLRSQKAGYAQALKEIAELIECNGVSSDYILQYCKEKLAIYDPEFVADSSHQSFGGNGDSIHMDDVQQAPVNNPNLNFSALRTARSGRPVLDSDDDEAPHKRRVFDLNGSWTKRNRR